jgi:transcriptional regulator with XRE-family HTH domain
MISAAKSHRASHSTNGGMQKRTGNRDLRIGALIRLRRTSIGMSQEKLGEILGVTFQQVQKYEKGTNRVSASRLVEIAAALDAPVGYFLDQVAAPAELPDIDIAIALKIAKLDPLQQQQIRQIIDVIASTAPKGSR